MQPPYSNQPPQGQPPMEGQPPYQQYPQQPPPGYYFQPPQGPYTPPKKSHKGLWIVLTVVLVVVLATCGIIGMAASAGGSHVVATSTATQPATTDTSNASTYKVGQTVNVDSTWNVTINKVSTNAGDGQFNVPKSGNTFLLVDVTEKNISSDQQNASGLVQYTLRGEDGTAYTQTPTLGTDPGGAVSAGQTIKGQLAYEVPKKVKQFTLAFQSALGSNQVTWNIAD
jgi:hypothetical protein